MKRCDKLNQKPPTQSVVFNFVIAFISLFRFNWTENIFIMLWKNRYCFILFKWNQHKQVILKILFLAKFIKILFLKLNKYKRNSFSVLQHQKWWLPWLTIKRKICCDKAFMCVRKKILNSFVNLFKHRFRLVFSPVNT